MRSPARLHRRHELRMLDVRDVEHANAAHAKLADRLGHAFEPAVRAAVGRLRGHEEQIPVDRHIVLRRRTEIRLHEHRLGGIGDVVDLEPVVVALNHVLARERQVRMRGAEHPSPRGRGREHPHVPRRLRRVPPAGLEAHAWIGSRRSRRHDGRNRRRHHGWSRRRWRRWVAASAASVRGCALGSSLCGG